MHQARAPVGRGGTPNEAGVQILAALLASHQDDVWCGVLFPLELRNLRMHWIVDHVQHDSFH